MNPQLALIIYFLATGTVAGLLGTTAMTFFLYYVTKMEITNANMVDAIGSMFTHSVENSWKVGILLHLTSGVAFGILYTLGFNLFEVQGFGLHLLVGTAFGSAHGFVMSFLLVSSVASHHPLPEFRQAGMGIAAAHLIGHVVFGFVVGAVVGYSGFTTVM